MRGELDRLDRKRQELEGALAEVEERLAPVDERPETADDVGKELAVLDNIWDNLFPGEQQRLVRTVIQQAVLYTDRLELKLQGDGLQSVVNMLVEENGKARSTSSTGGGTTISIPIKFKRRAGRRQIILPADAEEPSQPNQTLLLTLARAFRWKDLLESGRFPTVKALAEAVGLERSYVAKLLNLTLLSPRIVEAVVAGDEPDGLSISALRRKIPVRWDEQGHLIAERCSQP